METTARRLGFRIATCIGLAALLLMSSALAALQAKSPPAAISDPSDTPSEIRTGNEALATDQVVYTLGSTARISGSGFAAFRELTLRVSGPGGSSACSVAADANGSFTAAYDALSDGKYLVEVDGGSGPALAAVTFNVSSSSCPQLGTERLDANKVFYDYGETVHFTGSGYAPTCAFTLTVRSAGTSPFTTTVQSDANGNLASDYLPPSGVPALYIASIANNQGTQLAVVALAVNSTCNMTVGNPGTFTTIQDAVDALPNTGPGPCTITVDAGTYNESVTINSKNTAATADSERYIIRADPSAPVGAVKVRTSGSSGVAFTLTQSRFITIRGFDISATTAGLKGVSLAGGGSASTDITIEGNVIHDIGGTGSAGQAGIDVNTSSARAWIVNNLIRNMGRTGVAVDRADPTYVVNNTLVFNNWNGISRNLSSEVHLVNNLIVNNGTTGTGGTGNCQAGLCQTGAGTAALATLKNNIFYKNGTGLSGTLSGVNDISDAAATLDATDSGNFTTNGHANSTSSPTTGIAGCTFSSCDGSHAYTEIFVSLTDFHLRTSPPPSPAIDKGLNTYVHNLREWVPSVANVRAFAPQGDGADSPPTTRPQGIANDAGYDETPPAAVCGNGTVEGSEQCDQGTANGTLGSCCSATCTFKPSGTACTDDGNTCTADQCNGTSATCQHPALTNGSACNDSNACTQTDTCQGGACTGSNPVTCTASDQCHNAGTCDPTTGVCSNPAKNDGTGCNDGNACTSNDTCTAGVCVGNPLTCTAADQCHDAGTCDPSTGACSNPAKPNGTECDDLNACTQTDTCQAGTCTGSNPVTCTASDQCHNAGVCSPATGLCSNPPKANGSTCSDSDACTQSDSCQAGACVGSNPVVCSASDQCHVAGMCDPATGVCSNPAAPDSTPCNDGDACTQTDTCQVGVCSGSNPVTCTASDQCHVAGTCDPSTGECSNPNAANGTACNDGDACTQTDTCQAGSCSGSNPVTCTASDQCHTAGTCDPATGMCSNPAAANGTACNDGDACTQSDTCEAGTCVGSDPVVCTASDQCHFAGTCDPSTGACSNPPSPDNTPCNDGDACTQTDTCQSGTCTGSNAIVCTPIDQCHTAGTCDPGTGVCSSPPQPDNTPCSDGDACTQTDSCQGGSCTGSNPVTCTALDQCHNAGTCDPSTGICSNPEKPDGTACNDSNACTSGDSCSEGVCTPGSTVSCDDGNVCTTDACDPASGCFYTDNTNPCDDGNACTTVDTCSDGSCQGTLPPDCDDGNECTADSCNPSTGCEHEAISCDDNDPSTADICDPATGCEHVQINTPGKVTGGGQVEGELAELKIQNGVNVGGLANFGFVVQLDESATVPRGNLLYIDHGPVQEDLKATSIDSLFIAGNQAIFTGRATVNGVPNVGFRVEIGDMGEPGSNPTPPPDTFRIVVDNGYTAGGILLKGNIQVHPSP